jgi:glycolate oxidase iron-sulfur subunit
MGYKIIIPKGQTCCAIPLLFHGAKDMALENIHANINALKNLEVDAVLVDCTTCGEALKTEYPRLIEGQDPENSHARAIAAKVTDILSFIHSHFDRLEFDPGFTEERPITYHEPCHSRNGRTSNIRAESLLQSLEFVTYQRADDAEECCGGGGTFFYEFPEISKKMVAKKIETVRKLATGLWLTDCPVCRMNLAGNLSDTDNLSVLHPITLIHSALKQT